MLTQLVGASSDISPFGPLWKNASLAITGATTVVPKAPSGSTKGSNVSAALFTAAVPYRCSRTSLRIEAIVPAVYIDGNTTGEPTVNAKNVPTPIAVREIVFIAVFADAWET